jgi:hypothetical protein
MDANQDYADKAKEYLEKISLFDRSYFPNSDPDELTKLESRLVQMVESLTDKPGRLTPKEWDAVIEYLMEIQMKPDLFVYQFLTMLNSIVILNLEMAYVNSLFQKAAEATGVVPPNRVGGYL